MADTEPVGASTEVASPASAPGTVTPQPASPETAAENSTDLTKNPQFRQYQSNTDRKIAESEREKAAIRAQLNEIAAQLEAVREEKKRSEMEHLETLDPAEKAEAYKRRLADRDAQDRAREAQAKIVADQNRIKAQASAIVAEAGLNPNDPRLADIWQMGASQEAVDALTKRATALVKQDAEAERAALKAELEALKRAQPAQAKSETQKAVVAALNSAGVTATSSAPSAIAPVGADEATMKAMREKWNRNKGKGVDNPVIADIERELRKIGKTSADLFQR